jgi:DNA polymerase-3 subunit gamma/tau
VGLDRLNTLAEAFAANDEAAVLKELDEILGTGVAIEQFVIDLAGYYRSLLFLKNGITRESLLGYEAGRFSQKLPSTLSAQALENSLSTLLELYRNLRYCLSPRFELESALVKLCWMDKWISPQEMSGAIAEIRSAFLGAGKLPSLTEGQAASRNNFAGEERSASLTENFKKLIAEKNQGEAAPPSIESIREKIILDLKEEKVFLASALEKSLPWEIQGDELVIPVKDSLTLGMLTKEQSLIASILGEKGIKKVRIKEQSPDQAPEHKETPPELEMVRHMFRGTIVKEK